MAQRNYLINTTTISTTASGTTIGSGNTTSATFALARTLIRTGIAAGELGSGSRIWSIHYVVSAMTTPYEMRLKLQRLNSSGVMQSESPFGTVRSTTGTFDDDITWDSGVWNANDQLALVWEHRRPSGTGSKNGTVDANGASYIDAPLPITDLPQTLADNTNHLIDARGVGYGNLHADSVDSLVDTVQVMLGLSLALTDNAGSLADGTVKVMGVLHPTEDSLQPLADALIHLLAYELALADSEAAVWADAHHLLLAHSLALAEPLVLIDDAALLLTHETTLTDSVVLSDSIAITLFPPRIVYLDPGGDATHAVGHFNVDVNTTGLITFDGTQKVADAGSYRFDSDTGVEVPAAVNGVLDNTRRVSAYFRYDSVPDALVTASQFVTAGTDYSGGGFVSGGGGGNNLFSGDDDLYGEATPAKNSGQGALFPFPPLNVPIGAVIDSVKIIYERKYDVNTSIGVSRVKWQVDDEEGPNHDNTAMPLTDTVVEVDITGDRAWEWQHFQDSRFKVIAEARRGDTDTAHTQSWDYVKVEIVYHQPAAIMAGLTNSDQTVFRVAIRPMGEFAVLRFVDGAGNSYDGITRLFVDTDYRISFAYVYHGADNLDIALFVNGIPELLIEEAATGGLSKPVNLHYGWLLNPGVDHLCWFSHLYIDDGDDLTDPGNMLSTAKLSAAVNEDNWDTAGGTGAVNERPLSETNYIMQTAFNSVRQTYTLQTVAAGDVDLSGESLVGYMGWAWAKREAGSVERIGLIVNNVDVSRNSIGTSPMLLKLPVTSTSYPSHAAGIGMSSNSEDAGVFMYECGAVVAYEGPANPDILLEHQQLNSETLPTIVDDLRADPPDSYEVCCTFDDFDGSVEIVIHALDQDGGSLSYQGTLYSKGRVRVSPGVEVQLDVTVTGVTNLQIWRRINFD